MEIDDDDLTELCQSDLTVHELLLCTPFDPQRNFGGFINPGVFFRHLFVENDSFKALRDDLHEKLTNRLRNYQIIFLEGFSGTGKTTFIKYFIGAYPKFESIYIDFYPQAQTSPIDPPPLRQEESFDIAQRKLNELIDRVDYLRGEDAQALRDALKHLRPINAARKQIQVMSEQGHPIGLVLKTHLGRQDQESQTDFLYFLRARQKQLAHYLSPDFAARLRDFQPKVEVNRYQSFLQPADLRDTFILFFLYYASRYERQRSQKTHLIIFDNLDTVQLAYLTRFFKETFVSAFAIFSELSQDRAIFSETIGFSSKFKFLFCLRDANNTTINAHASERMDLLSVPLYFRIGFDSDLYQMVMSKRIVLFRRLEEKGLRVDEIQLTRKVVEMLMAFSNDTFFTGILAPLLNFNFRKLTHLLFEVTVEMVKSSRFRGGLSFENVSPDSFTETPSDKYGMKGAIFYGIMKKLRESNFLNKYPFTNVAEDPAEGYCLSTRMVLSALLNKSGLEASRHVLGQPKPFKDVSLAQLLQYCRPLYDDGEIFTVLIEGFLLHRESWVHLVTFRDHPVEDKDAFNHELGEIISSGQIPERLQRVLVTLNPSGFIFLKNLIVHFEFYSVLANNPAPLFALGLEKGAGGDGSGYRFELCISNVQFYVLKHAVSMNKFYQHKFVKAGWTEERYLASDYVFKHFKQGAPKQKGFFHIVRVVSRHIAYLDRFRLWVLQRNEESVERSELIEVNRKLVAFIEKYLGMLTQWSPGQGQFASYKESIGANIDTIKGNRFDDFKTHIVPREGEFPL